MEGSAEGFCDGFRAKIGGGIEVGGFDRPATVQEKKNPTPVSVSGQ